MEFLLDDGGKIWVVDEPLQDTAVSGIRLWLQTGEHLIHRIDGPAIEYADGSKHWYVDGKRHRLDGPATEHADGSKSWWVDNKRHRIDGPAIELADGSKSWVVNGNRHRIDGPAVIGASGRSQFWIRGKRLNFTAHAKKYNIAPNWRKWTDADRLHFRFSL
jgi:phage gp46-like protein